jgi:hypothetical protein
MKNLSLAILAWLSFAAATANAEYGTWQKIYSLPGTPGLSSTAFMSLGIGDADNLYTAGVQQTGGLSIVWGWDSHDGGADWSEAIESSVSGTDCSILNLFSFTLTAAASGPNNAVWAGLQVKPECIQQYSFPGCLFACMMQLEPVIHYTTDGGKTINDAVINGGGLLEMIMTMQFVDAQTGYAGGDPGVLFRTQDGGLTWTRINGPGLQAPIIYDMKWFDVNTGLLVSGIPEQSSKSGDRAQQLLHEARWLKDPLYRMNWREAREPDGDRGQFGRIWRTTDGGEHWEQLHAADNASFLNIEMLDEQHGFVIGEPHTGSFPLVMLETTDGGDTWTDVTSRLPHNLPNVLKWAVSSMAFQPVVGDIGFIGGAGENLKGYLPVLFYTEDSGATWALDESVVALANPILQVGWATPKLAYSVGFELSVFKYTQQHVRPKANAGPDGTGVVGQPVNLDGSASFDYDGNPLTYAWSKTSGPTAEIKNPTAVKTTFVASEVGDAVFSLSVNDGFESDTASVTYKITAPAADDDASPADDDNDDEGSPAPASSGSNSKGAGCGC